MKNTLFKKGLIVGIIVLLAGISLMPLVGSITINRSVLKTCPLGLDLSCDEPYKNVKQGDTATFIVEITNIGTVDDTYDVIAGSIEDIICKVNGVNADQFNPYEITLDSGESISFEVTAEVWESVPLGEWYVFVEGWSQNDAEINDDLTLTAKVQKKNKEKFSTRELIEEEDSVSWNLGFILCRVCFMETWSWFIKGMPGQRIECIDLDTGEIVYKGKTRIFGYFLFKFFPFGHDYKITAETEYGRMSKKINDLDFFQKVELLFIIGH